MGNTASQHHHQVSDSSGPSTSPWGPENSTRLCSSCCHGDATIVAISIYPWSTIRNHDIRDYKGNLVAGWATYLYIEIVLIISGVRWILWVCIYIYIYAYVNKWLYNYKYGRTAYSRAADLVCHLCWVRSFNITFTFQHTLRHRHLHTLPPSSTACSKKQKTPLDKRGKRLPLPHPHPSVA